MAMYSVVENKTLQFVGSFDQAQQVARCGGSMHIATYTEVKEYYLRRYNDWFMPAKIDYFATLGREGRCFYGEVVDDPVLKARYENAFAEVRALADEGLRLTK